MAEEIGLSFEIDFQLSRTRDLDLRSGHTAYFRASLVDLYAYAKFHWNRRNILWKDGRTHGLRYARTFETGIIRSTLSKSWPKMETSSVVVLGLEGRVLVGLNLKYFLLIFILPLCRVFSQSGLIGLLRPHRVRMSDSLLETLVFRKCNSDMF